MILLMLALQAATPSAEAEALGLRLARAGTLATVLPLVAQKETEEMVAAHPELSSDEQRRLRAAAARTLASGGARVDAAFGHAYATRFTAAELRTLVAQAESAEQRRFRAALPAVMAEAMGGVGTLDFKGETLAAFCTDTGKLCPK